MSADDFDFLIAQVSDILEQLGMQYGIVGSVASSRYGENRSTNDVDVLIAFRTSQLGAFCAALEQAFYVDKELILEAIAQRSSFNVVHLETGAKFDFFIPKNRAYDQVALQRRREGIPAFLQVEDVLLGKLEWYKATDYTSERQWRDVLGLLRFNPQMDFLYLRHWAGEIGVLDLLETAWEAV